MTSLDEALKRLLEDAVKLGASRQLVSRIQAAELELRQCRDALRSGTAGLRRPFTASDIRNDRYCPKDATPEQLQRWADAANRLAL